MGGETGVARRLGLTLQPVGLPSSLTAHTPAGAVSLWQWFSKCGPQTAAPAGVSPGSSLETQSLRRHLRPVESDGST